MKRRALLGLLSTYKPLIYLGLWYVALISFVVYMLVVFWPYPTPGHCYRSDPWPSTGFAIPLVNHFVEIGCP
jgi:hypothetical protein